ncbi:MAG: hypothetical protein IKY16_09150, partial [Bacteroidales bacterium]|nr:hypothetical protein [Bacteroidales bacterium]
YEVTVTVSDNGDGTLDVVASDNAKTLNFVNKYEAEGEIVLEGTKTLVGRTLAAGEFSFELKDEAGNVVATATNDASGKIAFTKIAYTTKDIGKTYTYTATEVAGSLAGVTYDGAPVTVEVTITDNGDGTLTAGKKAGTPEIAFTNTYAAEGAIILAGTKSLSGRELAAGEFSFELYDEAGTLLQTATNDVNGAFAFEEIKYELADAGKTFTYKVKEAKGELGGVTYDEAVITVKVEVTDIGGKLSAVLTQDSQAIAFVNKYEAAGEITFEGTKSIDGRDMTEDDVFTFEITDGKNTWTAENDSTGKIAYPTLTYTLADVGTHTYTVKETSTGGNGITVATNSYTVTVKVSDNGDGKLNVESEDDYTALDFVNEYAATGEITFEGTKSIDGREMTEDDVFSFEITEGDTVIATVNNDAEGKIAYPTIEYTLDDVGTHTYVVKETSENGNGITVATNSYEVTVTVSDNGDGKLDVVASDNATALNFVNKYEAEGEITFEGTKSIDGREMTEDDVFTFEITDGKNTWTAKNDKTGKIAYPTIEYTLADVGTHTYVVKETSTDGNGITVDTNTYEVTVTVSDNGDSTLTVES